MPGTGYSTLSLKPSILALLGDITDKFYPGMFYPSTLIILMNEVKQGRYTIKSYKHRIDFSGKYSTLTVRSDVKGWMDAHHEEHKEQYRNAYGTKSYSHFVSYFLANLFESKYESQNNVIRLRVSDFEWLRSEYELQKREKQQGAATDARTSIGRDGATHDGGGGNKDNDIIPPTFERFVDEYVNGTLQKMRRIREVFSS